MALLSLRDMKLYLACREEIAKKMMANNCVMAKEFSGAHGYIPLAVSIEQAVQLLFASRHAPHKAATEPGICVQMLELEMPQGTFEDMITCKIVEENENYNPPAYRMRIDELPLEMGTFKKYEVPPPGIELWAEWALKFKGSYFDGKCKECGATARVWTDGWSWWCAQCWNQHFVSGDAA